MEVPLRQRRRDLLAGAARLVLATVRGLTEDLLIMRDLEHVEQAG